MDPFGRLDSSGTNFVPGIMSEDSQQELFAGFMKEGVTEVYFVFSCERFLLLFTDFRVYFNQIAKGSWIVGFSFRFRI